MRLSCRESTLGRETSRPPSPSHPPHWVPSHHRWSSVWSGPRANASSRLGPQLATPGDDMRTPPSDSHWLHSADARLSGNGLSLVSWEGEPGGKCSASTAENRAKPSVRPVSLSYVWASVGPAAWTIWFHEYPSC